MEKNKKKFWKPSAWWWDNIFWEMLKTTVSFLLLVGGVLAVYYIFGNKPSETPIKESVSLEEQVDKNTEDILGLKEHIIDLYHVECKKLRRELKFEGLK